MSADHSGTASAGSKSEALSGSLYSGNDSALRLHRYIPIAEERVICREALIDAHDGDLEWSCLGNRSDRAEKVGRNRIRAASGIGQARASVFIGSCGWC